MTYEVKDSGKRMVFDSGMQRDTATGKVDYTLALDGPMFDRWAIHLTKGALKYDARNWMKAAGEAELTRFREAALRHFLQWFRGEDDEDHAAAVFFNINGVCYVEDKIKGMGGKPTHKFADKTVGDVEEAQELVDWASQKYIEKGLTWAEVKAAIETAEHPPFQPERMRATWTPINNPRPVKNDGTDENRPGWSIDRD